MRLINNYLGDEYMKFKVKQHFALSLIFVLLLTSLVGCSDQSESVADTKAISSEPAAESADASENKVYTPGTYRGEAKGKEGTIVVDVTFDETAIKKIEVVTQSETEGIGAEALKTLQEQIVKTQSLGLDAVSGASETSYGMLEAVATAVEQAGGNVEALKAVKVEKENKDITEKLSADVVVIGAGASGTSAAVSAADSGAKVILIEKTATIGGASNLSWAGKFYNSSASVENGLNIAVEDEIANWIVNNHWRVDASAIRQYVTKSGETYDWLAEKGYQTQFLNFGGEPLHMLPAYEERQGLLRKMLADSVESNGGQVLTETTGKSLMTDENGNVIGVVAEKADGTLLEISAKSVVLATGGYAANSKMVKELFGFEGINGGLGQNVGEGLKMAWDIGAKVPDNVGGQMLHQTLAKSTKALKEVYEPFKASYPLMLTYLPSFMNVAPAGNRFRDETATLTAVAAANTSAFNGAYHLVIVSESQLEALESNGMAGVGAKALPGMPPEFYMSYRDQYALDTPWTDVKEVFEKMVANGDGFKGNSPEELAQNAGMDVDYFMEAFNNYQKAIETGVDNDFGKSSEYLVSMGESGPYYAIVAEINNLGSVGGLLVNKDFQVLNDKRVPIKGLYAVGLESEGVLFNDTYVGNGVGIGYSFTSGRLGGNNAALDALEK